MGLEHKPLVASVGRSEKRTSELPAFYALESQFSESLNFFSLVDMNQPVGAENWIN